MSFTGERVTEVACHGLNYIKHSYTIQPILTASGKLLSPVWVNLQESSADLDGNFGPLISSRLPNFQNVYVTCSTSGFLTTRLLKRWVNEVFCDKVEEKCVLYLDSWNGQKDEDIFKISGKEIEVKTFAKNSTDIAQPLDQNGFGPWKYFVKRIEEEVLLFKRDVDIFHRDNCLKIHSLVLNQLQV